MIKLSIIIYLFPLLVLITGCATPDEKANKLFVEASQSFKLAQDQEIKELNYSAALKLYE